MVLAPTWLVTDPTKSHLPPLPLLFCQGQELTIRQISLLGFRDLVLLKVKLEDLLLLAQPQPPSSIVQMLLILQVRHDGDITAGRGKAALWLEHPGSVSCSLVSWVTFQFLCPFAVRAASTVKVPLLPQSPRTLGDAP